MIEAAKKVEAAMAAQARSTAKRIEKLKSKVVVLKGLMYLPPPLCSWKPSARKLVA